MKISDLTTYVVDNPPPSHSGPVLSLPQAGDRQRR